MLSSHGKRPKLTQPSKHSERVLNTFCYLSEEGGQRLLRQQVGNQDLDHAGTPFVFFPSACCRTLSTQSPTEQHQCFLTRLASICCMSVMWKCSKYPTIELVEEAQLLLCGRFDVLDHVPCDILKSIPPLHSAACCVVMSVDLQWRQTLNSNVLSVSAIN